MSVALRQVVLAVSDLDANLTAWRGALGLGPGARDADMATFGLEHEVLGVGAETFLELVAPVREDASVARLLARCGGDCGYMLALHIRGGNAATFHAHVEALGHRVVMTSSYRGSDIVQLHPRAFGTLLQISHVDARWHWHDLVAPNTTGTIGDEITAVRLAVDDPAGAAATWAELLGIAVETGATVLPLDQGAVEFVEAGPEPGLVGFTVHAVDRRRAGDRVTIGGVTADFG